MLRWRAKWRGARRLTRKVAGRAKTKDMPTWLLTQKRNLKEEEMAVVAKTGKSCNTKLNMKMKTTHRRSWVFFRQERPHQAQDEDEDDVHAENAERGLGARRRHAGAKWRAPRLGMKRPADPP